MIFLNRSISIFPVGLEKDLNPLGHSGHLRLQAVVGSIVKLIGTPAMTGLFINLDIIKPNAILQALNVFEAFNLDNIFLQSFKVPRNEPVSNLISCMAIFHNEMDGAVFHSIY